MMLRTGVENIPQAGRQARGSRVIDVREPDQVAAVARLESSKIAAANGQPNGEPSNGTDDKSGT